MLTGDHMLETIERFIKAAEMSPSSFGRKSVGDPALIGQLRKGSRSLTLRTVDKINAFIAAHDSDRTAA